MTDILSHYNYRRQQFQEELQEAADSANRISNWRLLTAVLGILVGTLSYVYINFPTAMAALLGFFIVFIYLVNKYQKITDQCNYLSALVSINDTASKRVQGRWKEFEDSGEEFLDGDHRYAEDLDIFGEASLFQWINATTTYTGRQKLYQFLISPCETIDQITNRQEAITELGNSIDWRQKFMAEGMVTSEGKKSYLNPSELFSWANNYNDTYRKPWLIWITRTLPIITIAMFLAYWFANLPIIFPLVGIMVQIAMVAVGYKNRETEFALTQKHAKKLKSYINMIELLEATTFQSNLLQDLQNKLFSEHPQAKSASSRLQRLEGIVEAISHRSSQFYLLFNILFLMDYHFQIALEAWKYETGDELEGWFDCIGELEALNSIAIIPCDHPDWAMPEFTSQKSVFKAEELGHPLLTDKRVCNDIDITPPVTILLVTGSNMSGKSTLLRTTGINLVLGYIGAPVCARSLNCSFMKVYTCMRVNDDLDKNLSSFYAELLRIREIVQEAERQETQVFFLLDEIFKGTNSRDRHTGAKAVIKKLQEEAAMGLVSTHDLELGALEGEQEGIKNYHFREFYRNSEIVFDYQLRRGLSQTSNARFLMRMAGIYPEED